MTKVPGNAGQAGSYFVLVREFDTVRVESKGVARPFTRGCESTLVVLCVAVEVVINRLGIPTAWCTVNGCLT